MQVGKGFAAGIALLSLLTAQAHAQAAPPAAATLDPARRTAIALDDIPWTGNPGRLQQYNVVGDQTKPGPYVVLIKWFPGATSKPHFHEKPRTVTVLSGTWWASTSARFDWAEAVPLSPGTVVREVAGGIHWEGAKDGPAIIEIVGEGPVASISVDEQGKPVPRAPAPTAPSK